MLRRFALWSALIIVIAWSGQLYAGWIINETVHGAKGRRQVFLQANRMKSVMIGEDGKPAIAFIIDFNSETITQVDYGQRYYTNAKVQDYVQMIQGAMADASRAMEEALKNMPPEQRKMMEQMMPSHVGAGAPAAGVCREPRVEVRKTNQQATIAGYQAVRYDVLNDGKASTQLWIAKAISAWTELDAKKIDRFAAEMRQLASCNAGRGQRLPGADPSWKVASEGYPVRTIDASGASIEVVKAEHRNVPDSEFQPPAGFAKKSPRAAMGQ